MSVSETGIKLRTKLESCKTLKMTTTATGTVAAGQIITVGAVTGVVVEAAAVSTDYVLVYEAEKIVLPITTETITVGQLLYFAETAAQYVSTSTASGTKAGIALETAGTTDTEILMDMFQSLYAAPA